MTRRFLTAVAAPLLLSAFAHGSSPVTLHGALTVREGNLVGDFSGKKVRLAGMTLGNLGNQDESLVWSASTIGWLATDWGCSLVRVGMDVGTLPALESYRNNPNLAKGRVHQLVQGAVERGLYVVVFWHEDSLSDHPDLAKDFFEEMAMAYGDRPNVLFEPYAGLSGDAYDWARLRKLHEEILAVIRPFSPNPVIVSTPRDSRQPDAVLDSPLGDANVLYAQKLDPASDQAKDRERLGKMVASKLPVLVTHLSTALSKEATTDLPQARSWKRSLDTLGVSWCGWSVSRSTGGVDALVASASPEGSWTASDLTPTGAFFRSALLEDNQSRSWFDTFALPGMVDGKGFSKVGFDHALRGKSGERPRLELFPGGWADYQTKVAAAFRGRILVRAWAGSAGTLSLKSNGLQIARIPVAASSGASMTTIATSDSITLGAGLQELRLEWTSSDTGRLVLDQFETDPGETPIAKKSSPSKIQIKSTHKGLEVSGHSSGEVVDVVVSDLQGRILVQTALVEPVSLLPLEQRGVLVVRLRQAQGISSRTILR